MRRSGNIGWVCKGDIHDQLGDRDAARESYKRARTLARRYEMNPTEILGVQGPG